MRIWPRGLSKCKLFTGYVFALCPVILCRNCNPRASSGIQALFPQALLLNVSILILGFEFACFQTLLLHLVIRDEKSHITQRPVTNVENGGERRKENLQRTALAGGNSVNEILRKGHTNMIGFTSLWAIFHPVARVIF
jgi:hypothetical protein